MNWEVEGPVNLKVELMPDSGIKLGDEHLFAVTWQREGEACPHIQLCSGANAFQEDDLPADVLEAMQKVLIAKGEVKK